MLALATAAIPAAPNRRVGGGRHFAQLLRRGRVQRQHVQPAARCFRRCARRIRDLDADGLRGRGRACCRRFSARLIDLHGYAPVTAIASVTPLAACALLVDHEGRAVKQRLKRWIFGLLGKDPDAVVVTFASGPPELCRRMADEVRALIPDRRHSSRRTKTGRNCGANCGAIGSDSRR